jgi:hypothetical protein
MGANSEEAAAVAQQVERKLYDGISTREILQIVFDLMREHKPAVEHVFDLRYGISLMVPKPEFEVFVRVLLSHSGFQVKPNAVLKGLCGEHEVDAIAVKDGLTYLVEAKHHSTYHALTGLDESRIARAILEDVTEGYKQGVTAVKVDGAMIVTNTRYSEHAIAYGGCRGVLQVGWVSPDGFGIKDIVEKHWLYPLSCLRELNPEARLHLVEAGIVLIKQLQEQDRRYLERKIGLSPKTVSSLMENARHATETLWH